VGFVSERNLILRVASAAVGLPILAVLIFWREPLGFGLFSLGVAALALHEYAGLTLRNARLRDRLALVVVGTGFAAAVYFQPDRALAWAGASVVLLAFLTLLGADDLQASASRLGMSGFGVFYVGGLLVALPLMHRDLPQGSFWVTIAIAVTFANDTGAYFLGRAIGRHKLAPAVSPGKTIEGGVGGLGAAVGFMLVARATFFPGLSLLDALVIGAAASVLGPAGDLIESLLKRAAGAKDSGRLIPGHGGVLDRVDALLFVGAFVHAYARFWR
jgi:phosphatidate cytidylyltransferase